MSAVQWLILAALGLAYVASALPSRRVQAGAEDPASLKEAREASDSR
jgi:hypothetical protein